jgi:hypothetical protein
VRYFVGLILALSLVFAAPLTRSAFAHGTGKHVMGTATVVEADHLGMKTKEGKEITVLLTPKTQFKRSGPPGPSTNLQVGDRVVVEVTEKGKDLTAIEVRFSTPQLKK